MQKVNIKDVPEETWASPSGKFGNAGKEISIALGRKPASTDLTQRHPFDVEITRGLVPINTVLAGVPFRHGSHLAIEPADRPSSNLQEFRKVVLAFTRDNPLGNHLYAERVHDGSTHSSRTASLSLHDRLSG